MVGVPLGAQHSELLAAGEEDDDAAPGRSLCQRPSRDEDRCDTGGVVVGPVVDRVALDRLPDPQVVEVGADHHHLVPHRRIRSADQPDQVVVGDPLDARGIGSHCTRQAQQGLSSGARRHFVRHPLEVTAVARRLEPVAPHPLREEPRRPRRAGRAGPPSLHRIRRESADDLPHLCGGHDRRRRRRGRGPACRERHQAGREATDGGRRGHRDSRKRVGRQLPARRSGSAESSPASQCASTLRNA